MRYPRGFWGVFGAPGLLWVALFFIIPVYTILAIAMGKPDPIFLDPNPTWNPLEWDVSAFETVFSQFGPGETFYVVFVRTFAYVAVALALSLAIGYPVAYFIARHGGRWKTLLLIGLVAPFWISYLMRMLAWVNLLSDSPGRPGLINQLLTATPLFETPVNWGAGNVAHMTVIL
ncbi:MAG: ABC transporter permease, partial [Gaiellales bacterium]